MVSSPAGGAPNAFPTRRSIHHRKRETHRKKMALTLAVLMVIGTFGALGSWAAWQVSNANTNNTFSTSTILLSDNQGGQAGTATSTGTAMFNVTSLSPGSAANTACIGVKYAGASASTMKLSAALGGADANLLDDKLTMDVATYNPSGTVAITPGSNSNAGACTNYPGGGTNTAIGTQGAALDTWVAGAGGSGYTITPGADTWYKFTVSGLPVSASSCATYCGKTITIALTWTLTTI